MKERFIVLTETVRPSATRVFLGSAKGTRSIRRPSGRLDLRVDELDPASVPRLARNGSVIAPAMPMRLIRPVTNKKKRTAGPKAAKPDWGVRAVGAARSPYSGDGIVVAVLDTGIDAAHPAFKGVTLVQRNFTEDPEDEDIDGHGTHCAGTIFGRDVKGTRIGIARGVTKALIGKVIGEDGADTHVVAQAIQWAINEGAHVVSMSLGFDFPAYQQELADTGLPADLATSRALDGYRRNVTLFERIASSAEAIGEVTGVASIIIAAAGNESRTDEDPRFKIAVSPPAISDGIISVAALGESPSGFVVAPFSNTGALIAGPGVDISSAKIGGGLVLESGTSMAAPHVAGVAALWAEKLTAARSFSSKLLNARLLASGSTDRLHRKVAAEDVGSGLVTAPAR